MGKGGLAFLNKKPWHPASMKNMEITWKAEQKEKKRKKRIEEHLKQIKEERAVEDLKKEQIRAGLITKAESDRMDWMYQTPIIKPNEKEYMLGAPIKQENALSVLKQETESVGAKLNPTNLKGVAAVIENETKLREDPMLEIGRKARSAREEILTNPVKMKKIYDEVKLLKELKKDKRLLKVIAKKTRKKKRRSKK
ncbi:RNA-splicing factor [Bonamia ostreae]|uniref:RNA-splicing factor n=1 Tax=Bonamia ostreae TaxID=126728 RepID=A0ABV2AM97_9EUKA